MTTYRVSPAVLSVSKFFWLLIAMWGVAAAPSIHAAGPPGGGPVYVSYSPDNLQSVQGDAPLHYAYLLAVTSPSSTPTNTTTVVTMTRTVVTAPDGADVATATGYLTFSVPTLSFTGPNQVRQVMVTVDIPTGTAAGDFTYWVTSPGWPGGYGINDSGTYINMHVNPQGALEPPTVEISSPDDGTEYTYTGEAPVQVPITVHGAATESAPVLTLDATLSGVAADGSVIPEVPLVLAKTGLGSSDSHGTVTLPITVAGEYTITATATNSVDDSVTSSTFIVNEVIAPPLVTINPPVNNPVYTYISGLTSVTVPYAFVAQSYKGGIQTLTATLDGAPFTIGTVAGIGNLTATGSGSFVFNASVPNASGQHTIAVTATDAYGTATAAATFVVNVLFPQIGTTIANPINGSTLYLPPDASPLNVPFNFTTVATNSATVLAISASLTDSDGNTVSAPLSSTSGLGTATANGAGTLLNVQPGTYTLGALGTNATLDLSSFASTTFTVKPPPPPVTLITQAPQAVYTVLAGLPLPIPFIGTTTSTGAYITNQVATLDGQPVTIVSTANGHALLATATGTLSLTGQTSGTTTHTLVLTGTDTYGQTSSAKTTFTVTVNPPVITIAINPQIAAQSPYTLPSSGSLNIPFVFTGNISAGATVDTIAGSLGSNPVTITSTTGLGSAATATASGTLTITAPGTYTLTATDTNTASGVSATTSVVFTVNKPASTPPALTICFTKTPLPTYYYQCGCSGLSIPYTFVAKSNGGKVQTVSATLDGKSVSLSSIYGTGTYTATASGTLSVKTAGVHTLVAIATDNYGQTVTTSTTFTVTTQTPDIGVSIDAPTADSVYYLPSSSSCNNYSSVKIPFSFTSTISAGATIDALSASLNGCSVSFTSSGIGTSVATGTGTLSVTKVGKYTLTVKGIDNTCGISATTSVVFYVQNPTPPTVDITTPTLTSYTSYSGCAALSIPYSFVATSPSGPLTKLTAAIDGQNLTVTAVGLGTSNATGSGTMAVRGSGRHTLTVTANTASGTARDSFTFYVTVVNPTPAIDISRPLDGATFSYNDGDPVPAIPFTFAATTNAGATISSLKASLGCNNIAVTADGIGTSAATGTGTITVSGPGTYTLTATATSGSASVSDKVTFTVTKVAAAKPCKVVWQSSACQGRVQRGGCDVPIKFQIQCKDGRDDSIVYDTSVKICVYEVYKNGSSSSPRVYSCSNYSIDRNRQYCLNYPADSGKHCYRVEIYRFPSGSSKPVLIGSQDCSTR